LQKYI
jgi:hypothetical protein